MGMGLRGFGGVRGGFRGFWGGILGDPGAKSDARRSLGGADFAESAGARRGALPCRSVPKAFLARRGVGRDLGGTGFSFLCRQDGAASIGATQRIKTIAFWAIYTYSNTYWRLKGSNAQKTHHHGRRGRL